MKYTNADLKELQSKSLEEKIQISSARIIEWYERWNGKVYVGFSGGKDSTVLLHLVRKLFTDVPAVFCNTGLEFPEIVDFIRSVNNVEMIYPEKKDKVSGKYKRYTFFDVIKDYGYPIISKEISNTVHCAHDGNRSWKKLNGKLLDPKTMTKSKFNSEKWKFLLDLDFRISPYCCNIMKKNPSKKYEKETGRKPYLGILAEESYVRTKAWMKSGCNAFDDIRAKSQPMAFWTEQDILQYIKEYDLSYANIYGELIEDNNGILHFTGEQRTGCIFCGFGCHMEKEPNRFQRLKKTHPNLYDYCMRGGRYDDKGIWGPYKGLGMAKVLKDIGVETDYDE